MKKLLDVMVPARVISYDEKHKNFLSSMVSYEEADAVIFGVPFDAGTQRHVGTNEGPIGIRDALGMFRSYSAELGLNITDYIKTADIGNVDAIWHDYEYTFKNVDVVMKELLKDNKFPIMLGGDHSVSYQAIKSICESTGKKLGFIWMDNHTDTMTDYCGDTLHCGTPMYHLLNEFPEQIKAKNISHMGSRGFQQGAHAWENAKDLGINVFGAEEIRFTGVREVLKKAIEKAADGTDAIYLTLDIDVADAIYAPGTQCNNPGGINSIELLYMVREVAKHGIIGFDVMEVAPMADFRNVTTQLAACAILECLAGQAWRKKGQK